MNRSKRIISSNVQLGESLKIPVISEPGKEKVEDKTDLILEEAKQRADSIIGDAQNLASKIIEEAKQKAAQKEQEIESLKNAALEKAQKEGFDSGYKEGAQKASKEIISKITNLDTVANSALKIKNEIILSAEPEILQLSTAIAERILKHQLEIKPELIIKIIKAAILELKDKEEIKVIVNPALKEQLYKFSEELKKAIIGMKTIKIVEDKTIHPDSAIIESPDSRIDARLEAQIAQISKELFQSYYEKSVLSGEIEEL